MTDAGTAPPGAPQSEVTRPTGPGGLWVALAVFALLTGAGVVAYWQSDAHARHDPVHALQQLDLLYLDERVPALEPLVEPGRPAVVVVCPGDCALPDVPDAQLVRTDDPAVARSVALLREDGGLATGYVLLDDSGVLRYRTVDPGLARHGQELRNLVAGLP